MAAGLPDPGCVLRSSSSGQEALAWGGGVFTVGAATLSLVLAQQVALGDTPVLGPVDAAALEFGDQAVDDLLDGSR